MYDWTTYDFSELPKSPDEIAAFLLAGGFKGDKVGAYSCPLSHYWTANVTRPEGHTPWGVCQVFISTYSLEDPEEETINLSGVPSAVSEFISRFDAGLYPELVS